MQKKIYIIHEYGAPRHFESLYAIGKKEDIEIVSLEFRIIKKMLQGVKRKSITIILRSIKSLLLLLYLLTQKENTIILGAAPYDKRIKLFNRLKKNNRIIYYSSWPFWDFINQPYDIRNEKHRKQWETFLEGIEVVAVTNKVKEGLAKYTSKITVIPHSINPEIFYSSPDNATKKQVIFVGRITKSKGINSILEVINRINDKSINWVFVGKGDLSGKIQELSKTESNIIYHGFVKNQSDLASLYRESQILVLPAEKNKKWQELFGISIIEAMACGALPVSTKGVGPLEIIENYKDGFLVDYNSEDQIEKAITEIFTNNFLLKTMKENAITKAKNKYSTDSTGRLWKEVLEN